jgi:hypothetical protein
MRKRFSCWMCFISLLIFLALIGCSSTKNRTEKRAKERITQFIRLMSEDQVEEAEKLLSRKLAQSEKMEFFLSLYDNWELKDTSIVIEVDEITFMRNDTNRAMASVTVSNDRVRFTKMANMALKFEKGDWYIGE